MCKHVHSQIFFFYFFGVCQMDTLWKMYSVITPFSMHYSVKMVYPGLT